MTAFPLQQPARPLVTLVDGDAGIRRSLRRFLVTHDLEVTVHGTGAELLAAPPRSGVIVADVSLPDMDALGLLQALEEQAIDRPVIVLASHRDARLAQRALARGAVDHIEKPFVDEVLVARIQTALGMEENPS